MTTVDRAAFAECFERLARAQGGQNDPATVAAYFDALQDLPMDAVATAAIKLAREGEYFPRAGKWHEVAQMAARDIVERLRPTARAEPWRHECETCQDTGWVERWVEEGELIYSQHYKQLRPAMYRHQVAETCVCRGTNRTYQRHHLTTATDATQVTDAEVKAVRKRAQSWKKPGA